MAATARLRDGATVPRRTEPDAEWHRDDGAIPVDGECVARWTYASPEGWTHAVAIADTGGLVDRFHVCWETPDYSHRTYRHVDGQRRRGPNVDAAETTVTAVTRRGARRVARRFREEIISTSGHAHRRRDEIVARAADVDRLSVAEYMDAWERAEEERQRWREERARIHAEARREWHEERERRQRLLDELERSGIDPLPFPEIRDSEAHEELVAEYVADEIGILEFEERVARLIAFPDE